MKANSKESYKCFPCQNLKNEIIAFKHYFNVPANGSNKHIYEAELIRYAYIEGLWVNPEEAICKWPHSIIKDFNTSFETHEGEFKSIKWIFP
jgi:hypothetical protein